MATLPKRPLTKAGQQQPQHRIVQMLTHDTNQVGYTLVFDDHVRAYGNSDGQGYILRGPDGQPVSPAPYNNALSDFDTGGPDRSIETLSMTPADEDEWEAVIQEE